MNNEAWYVISNERFSIKKDMESISNQKDIMYIDIYCILSFTVVNNIAFLKLRIIDMYYIWNYHYVNNVVLEYHQ